MKFYLLASGSAGNSTLIVAKNHLILVDMGLGIKEIKFKIQELGYDFDNVEMILVTHEHSDHIKSIKYADMEKVYATEETLPDYFGYNFIQPFKMIAYDNIHIVPVPISHDIRNGVGFVIDDGEESMVYMTDTGYVSRRYFDLLRNATHYVFESNHDIDMLLKTNRSFYLKRRILSDVGHLSNEDSGELLAKLIGEDTKTIVLAHLSEDANTKNLAYTTVRQILLDNDIDLSKIELKSADRYEITYGRDEYAIKK